MCNECGGTTGKQVGNWLRELSALLSASAYSAAYLLWLSSSMSEAGLSPIALRTIFTQVLTSSTCTSYCLRELKSCLALPRSKTR